MLAAPEELVAALAALGWSRDRGAQRWTLGASFIEVDGGAYRIGVLPRGIQPLVSRAVPYEAALAWVRRDLDAFARLANRPRSRGQG